MSAKRIKSERRGRPPYAPRCQRCRMKCGPNYDKGVSVDARWEGFENGKCTLFPNCQEAQRRKSEAEERPLDLSLESDLDLSLPEAFSFPDLSDTDREYWTKHTFFTDMPGVEWSSVRCSKCHNGSGLQSLCCTSCEIAVQLCGPLSHINFCQRFLLKPSHSSFKSKVPDLSVVSLKQRPEFASGEWGLNFLADEEIGSGPIFKFKEDWFTIRSTALMCVFFDVGKLNCNVNDFPFVNKALEYVVIFCQRLFRRRKLAALFLKIAHKIRSGCSVLQKTGTKYTFATLLGGPRMAMTKSKKSLTAVVNKHYADDSGGAASNDEPISCKTFDRSGVSPLVQDWYSCNVFSMKPTYETCGNLRTPLKFLGEATFIDCETLSVPDGRIMVGHHFSIDGVKREVLEVKDGEKQGELIAKFSPKLLDGRDTELLHEVIASKYSNTRVVFLAQSFFLSSKLFFENQVVNLQGQDRTILSCVLSNSFLSDITGKFVCAFHPPIDTNVRQRVKQDLAVWRMNKQRKQSSSMYIKDTLNITLAQLEAVHISSE